MRRGRRGVKRFEVITMEARATSTPRRRTGRPLSFDRDAALRQAMLTFWRYGYETASVANLTAAMGVTPPSLYAAFGDKERLFLEAMRLYGRRPRSHGEGVGSGSHGARRCSRADDHGSDHLHGR